MHLAFRILTSCITIYLSTPLICLSSNVAYLQLRKNKAITIVDSRTAQQELAEAASKGKKVLSYSSMTGVLIIEDSEANDYPVNTLHTLTPISYLYNENGKKEALVLGIERKKNGKVLPFGHIRVQALTPTIASGSFLFNEENDLVAIYYVQDHLHPNQGYAVPIKNLLRDGRDFSKNGTISRCWAGIITTPSNTVPEITGIRANSPAEKAGILPGDIILKVGETPINSYLEAVNAFYYLIQGEEETITLLRGKTIKEVSLTPVVHPSN